MAFFRSPRSAGVASPRDDEGSPLLRLVTAASVAGLAFGLHKQQLATNPQYASKLYKLVKTIEDRSPARVLRTLHISEVLSSYLPSELRVSRAALLDAKGITSEGRLYQRLLGLDLKDLTGDLVFRRQKAGSPFLHLAEAKGLSWTEPRSVRFAERGTLAGTATRLRGGVRPPVKFYRNPYENQPLVNEMVERFKFHRKMQNPSGVPRHFTGAKHEGTVFMPLYARRGGEAAANAGRAAEFYTFNFLERTQALLAKMGIGLQVGTYDKIAHLPFHGEGGLLNQLLSKRVLPAYVGLTYLGFADFMLGHRPSETAESLPAYAVQARAELTDRLPFARRITDFYKHTVPGPQYGPLALPAAGAFVGAMLHYGQVLGGKKFAAGTRAAEWVDKIPGIGKELDKFINVADDARKAAARSKWVAGALIGGAAMLPFTPGMLGSRKTADEVKRIYSGDELVPIRSGRWWEAGTAPWEGGKISYYRPHRMAVIRSGAAKKSLWGSESNYWLHHPLINPIGYLLNPYDVEEQHYSDRPYPISSPAFSDVPLIGPALAATVGRVVKPPVYMHEDQWRGGGDYRVGSALLQPRGPGALPGPSPQEEFGVGDVVNREAESFFEFIGFPGFLMQSAKDRITGKGNHDIYLQSSREMTSLSRKFYELNLGAGLPLDEGMSTEPIRRFIQREDPRLAVNDIPNTMPSWMPGPDDYAFSFRHGDPYVKVAEGYLRLPGAGYAALHPELEDVEPEDYPDTTKLSILADVAYGSTQYYQFKEIVRQQAEHDTVARIAYDEVLQRVDAVQKSAAGTTQRKFSGEVETVSGTVAEAGSWGVRLREYPGRTFQFSGVGLTAADMSALALGDANYRTQEQLASAVDDRHRQLTQFLDDELLGRRVQVTVPGGAVEHATETPAVIRSGSGAVNQLLIEEGLGRDRIADAGPEAQALFGSAGRTWGKLAEGMSFSGDQEWWNPLRYIPSPAHTKLWQERTPIEQYLNQEVYGTRLRRWDRLLDDFAGPYARGGAYRLTGDAQLSEVKHEQRDMDTLADYLKYLQGVNTGILTKSERTNVGTNLFSSPDYLQTTLPRHERPFFRSFLQETSPEKRQRILSSVSTEMRRTLEAQWARQEMTIAQAEGRQPEAQVAEGRPVDAEDSGEYQRAGTKLGYGDWKRSQEIAEFFFRRQLHLPDPGSVAYEDYMDAEDVKVRLLTQEGYDYHDFGVYEDRMALLRRKPYVDGAVRELVQPDGRSVESLRRAVEQMILAGRDKNPEVRVVSGRGPVKRNHVRITHNEDSSDSIRKDVRRHSDRYQ